MGLKVKVRRLDRLVVSVSKVGVNNISTPTIGVSATEVNLPADGTAQTLTLKSNTAWTVK